MFTWLQIRPRPNFSLAASGRARALVSEQRRLRRPTLAQSFVSTPEAKDNLSHLYKGMRLPPLSKHIESQMRKQRFCENVLLAAPLPESAAKQISKSQESTESTETLQNKSCLDLFAKQGLYL